MPVDEREPWLARLAATAEMEEAITSTDPRLSSEAAPMPALGKGCAATST